MPTFNLEIVYNNTSFTFFDVEADNDDEAAADFLQYVSVFVTEV